MSRPKSRYSKKYKPRRGRKVLFWLFVFLFIVGLTLVCGYYSYNYAIKSYLDSSKDKQIVINKSDEVEFVVPRGANTDKIASSLKQRDLIKNEDVFKILSKLNGYDGTYQSGTHIVSNTLSYDQMMRVLSSKPETRKVTIPEGKTFSQIVDILYNNKIIKDKASFIKAANTDEFDYDFLKGITPRDNRLEGYLFPDTYEYDLNVSNDDVIKKMLDNFDKKFKQEYKDRIPQLPADMTLDKVVTLASIIEREAKSAEERYIISGVFYNRLTSKDKTLNKLQSCATIQYILLKTIGSYKERLMDSDLKIDDPYNTYLYAGLPPGPICCPGEAAIKAALYPADTKYLYFVSKGDGTHQFSTTFKQHEAAISKYGLR